MKTRSILLIGLIAALLSSCLIKSLHPFFKESDVIYKKEFLGTWTDQDSAKWVISKYEFSKGFMKGDSTDNSYLIEFYEDISAPSKFNAHLFKIDNILYVDFFPVIKDQMEDFFSFHLVPTHSLARIEFKDNDQVFINWFSEQWIHKLFEENRVKISHETISMDGSENAAGYVLTASTNELQQFIRKYGNEIKTINYEDDKDFLCIRLNKVKCKSKSSDL